MFDIASAIDSSFERETKKPTTRRIADPEPDLELVAPVPDAPAGHDVLFLERVLGAVERGRRDHLVRDHVHAAAEDHDARGRGQQRPAERPVVRRVEEEEERRRCEQRYG